MENQLMGKEDCMSDKRLNNTIFLMYLVTENYKKEHSLSSREFLELYKKYAILNYVSECPDIFDSMTKHEMVEEIADKLIVRMKETDWR
jgi:hypothetical protein